MRSKQILQKHFDALRDTIDNLPEDVSICSITYHGVNDLMVQILEHPEITGERIRKNGPGEYWCEKKNGSIIVGWIEKPKEKPKVAHQCSCCDEPIYEGERAYEFRFGWVCEDCADKSYKEAK